MNPKQCNPYSKYKNIIFILQKYNYIFIIELGLYLLGKGDSVFVGKGVAPYHTD